MDKTPKKILVVDDNSAVLAAINGILSATHKVFPVNSAATALAFLKKQLPDLILLDIEMPQMNGLELYHLIREFPEHTNTPVIFLSGQDDIKAEAEVFSIGGADYIRKPINNIVIEARVKTQLELAAYRKSGNNGG